MKEQWVEYLKEIDITGPYLNRVEEIVNIYEGLYEEGVFTDIFVSDYFDKEGNRKYGSIFFFSGELFGEARNFLDETDIDIIRIDDKISYWRMQQKDFKDCDVSLESRLKIIINIHMKGVIAELIAARSNCKHLMDIMNRYIVTNF